MKPARFKAVIKNGRPTGESRRTNPPKKLSDKLADAALKKVTKDRRK
jgi:hypothetical protein